MSDRADRRSGSLLPTVLATWLRAPGVPFTLAVLALALPAMTAGRSWMVGDIWWVMKNGELLVQQGALGPSDAFTFGPHVANTINAQWLAQLIYYGIYRLGGQEAVIGVTALLASLIFAFPFHIAWRRTRSVVAAAIATMAVLPVAIWALNPRAQIFAFVLFAATLWLLTCAPRKLVTLAALGAVEVLWANMHGSFFLAPVLTGIVLTNEAFITLRATGWRTLLRAPQLRFLFGALLLQVLGSLVTPYGLDLYVYAARLTNNSIIRQYVSEWEPTSIDSVNGICFFLSAAFIVTIAARARRGITIGDALTLVAFGLLALEAVRNVVWWGIASAPVLAVGLAQFRMPRRMVSLVQRKSTLRNNLVRAIAIIVAVLAISPWARHSSPILRALAPASSEVFLPPDYPNGAAEYLLSTSLPQRVFADQPWGSYLDWELWPRYQMMVDCSVETHPSDVWMDVISISNAVDGWQTKLDDYGVDVLLLNSEREAALIKAADRSPMWQRTFADEHSVIFVRSNSPEAAL